MNMVWSMPILEEAPSSSERPSLERQVRDALARLYDPIYLRRHPLARELAAARGDATSPEAAGAALRQALLDAIETIRPAECPGGGERASRPYRIMQLRYVEALEPGEVQEQLCIAKTQYYRQHEQALQAVADAFAANLSTQRAGQGNEPAAAPGARRLRPLASLDGRRGGAAADGGRAGVDHERYVYLLPMANLADVRLALAALDGHERREQPVVFVVDRREEGAATGDRLLQSALA